MRDNEYYIKRKEEKRAKTQKCKDMGIFHWAGICPITGIPIENYNVRNRSEYMRNYVRKPKKAQQQ